MAYNGAIILEEGSGMAQQEPSIDQWLAEAKQDPNAAQCGMYLTHNGIVRITPKKQVREGPLLYQDKPLLFYNGS